MMVKEKPPVLALREEYINRRKNADRLTDIIKKMLVSQVELTPRNILSACKKNISNIGAAYIASAYEFATQELKSPFYTKGLRDVAAFAVYGSGGTGFPRVGSDIDMMIVARVKQHDYKAFSIIFRPQCFAQDIKFDVHCVSPGLNQRHLDDFHFYHRALSGPVLRFNDFFEKVIRYARESPLNAALLEVLTDDPLGFSKNYKILEDGEGEGWKQLKYRVKSGLEHNGREFKELY